MYESTGFSEFLSREAVTRYMTSLYVFCFLWGQGGYDSLYDVLVCTPPPQRLLVRAGDSLDAIAAAHGIPVICIHAHAGVTYVYAHWMAYR